MEKHSQGATDPKRKDAKYTPDTGGKRGPTVDEAGKEKDHSVGSASRLPHGDPSGGPA